MESKLTIWGDVPSYERSRVTGRTEEPPKWGSKGTRSSDRATETAQPSHTKLLQGRDVLCTYRQCLVDTSTRRPITAALDALASRLALHLERFGPWKDSEILERLEGVCSQNCSLVHIL